MTSHSARIEESLQRLEQARPHLQQEWTKHLGASGPPAFAALFQTLAHALLADPDGIRQLQTRYYREQLDLWLTVFGNSSPSAPGQALDPDPRFGAPEWREIPWFDYLRRSYGVSARWLGELLETVRADAATRRKLRFYGRQYIEAAAPSNFAPTNPEVIKLALQTHGESLAKGLENLKADADKGRVSMTDETAFEV
ncbi:MAG: hypothetical protein EHM59_20755, partial [Betaproteobacteria bacterium]